MKETLPLCLLFDLDGTLLDSLPGIAFSIREACLAEGLAEPICDLRSLLGPPIREILRCATNCREEEVLDALEKGFRASYDALGWKKTLCFPDAQQLLAKLHAAGHRLFVVTNKPRHITLRILEHLELLDFFEKIYTRDACQPASASKGEMLKQFLSEQAVVCSRCLMVGDTVEDILAAQENHMDAVLMEHGYGQVPDAFPVKFRLPHFSGFFSYLSVEGAYD